MVVFLFSALCAITLGAAPCAPKDTVDRYVINGEAVTGFNGSQLEGKKILDYTIAYKDLKKKVEKIHVITTEGEGSSSFSISSSSSRPTIIVDGKEVSEEAFGKLKTDDISSVTVYKSTTTSTVTNNGSKSSSGTIIVKTKGSDSTVDVYLDGKKLSEKELKNLDLKGNVVSTNVVSQDGKVVIEYVTKKK